MSHQCRTDSGPGHDAGAADDIADIALSPCDAGVVLVSVYRKSDLAFPGVFLPRMALSL